MTSVVHLKNIRFVLHLKISQCNSLKKSSNMIITVFQEIIRASTLSISDKNSQQTGKRRELYQFDKGCL